MDWNALDFEEKLSDMIELGKMMQIATGLEKGEKGKKAKESSAMEQLAVVEDVV